MDKFSIAEALRYITTGFVFLGGLYFYSSSDARTLVQLLGPAGIVGFAFTFGAILYPVYRGLFYNWAMPKMQDMARKTLKSDSYRTYLKREYGMKRKFDATRLYVALRDHQLKESHVAADATIANVHLGYTAALILGTFCASLVASDAASAFKLFSLSAVIAVGTFCFEYRFQSDEHARFLANCSSFEIISMAATLGIGINAGHANPELPGQTECAGNKVSGK